jgi:hypothetical protein
VPTIFLASMLGACRSPNPLHVQEEARARAEATAKAQAEQRRKQEEARAAAADAARKKQVQWCPWSLQPKAVVLLQWYCSLTEP